MEILINLIEKNGLVFGFLVIGLIVLVSDVISKKYLKGKYLVLHLRFSWVWYWVM